MKHKILWSTLSVIVVAGALVIGNFFRENHDRKARFTYPELKVKKWQADTQPLVSEKEFKDTVRKANKGNDGISLKEMKSVVIPGLRGAWSIDPKTKQAALGKDWVPQGLTQNDTQYFISAYDGDHKLNSLIFVVDKKTKKYVKTLILNNRSHVGGLAYDTDYHRLWISEDTKAFAGVAAVDQKQIDDYHAEVTHKAITTKKFGLPWAARTSGLNFYNDQIIIVKYGQTKDSRSIIAMPVQADGYPAKVTDVTLGRAYDPNIDKFIDNLVKAKVINSMAPGYDRLQGLTTTNLGLTLFSQSNGDRNSKIMVKVPNRDSGRKFDFFSPSAGVKSFTVPPSVEQISVNNPKDTELAMLFESGAEKYRTVRESKFGPYPAISDRLLILPIDVAH